jgi:hypothetical protein
MKTMAPVPDPLKHRDGILAACYRFAFDDAGAGAQGHSAHQGGSGARPRSLTILRHRVTISAWTPLYVSWCCLRCSPRSFAVWRLSTPSRLRQQCSLRSPAAAWSSLRGCRAAHGLEGLARFAQRSGSPGSSRPDECPRNSGAAGRAREAQRWPLASWGCCSGVGVAGDVSRLRVVR